MAIRLSNGTGGGNFSSAATWAVAVPAEGDTALILSTDTVTLDHDAFTLDTGVHYLKIGSDGFNDASIGTVSAVNTTTEVLTVNTHGLSVGDAIGFLGTVPAPVVVGTVYFVETVVDSNNIKISISYGGAVLNMTATTTGATVYKHICSIINQGIVSFAYDTGSANDLYEIWHKGSLAGIGEWKIGTEANPLATRKLTQKLNYSATPTINRYNFWQNASSIISYYSQPKTTYTYLTSTASSGSNVTLTVSSPVTNWRVGDRIALGHLTTKTLHESLIISSITDNGNGTFDIGTTGTLTNTRNTGSIIMMNSTNIVFTSQDTTKQTSVSLNNANNVLSYVTFEDLGSSSPTTYGLQLNVVFKASSGTILTWLFTYNMYATVDYIDNNFFNLCDYKNRSNPILATNNMAGLVMDELNVIGNTQIAIGVASQFTRCRINLINVWNGAGVMQANYSCVYGTINAIGNNASTLFGNILNSRIDTLRVSYASYIFTTHVLIHIKNYSSDNLSNADVTNYSVAFGNIFIENTNNLVIATNSLIRLLISNYNNTVGYNNQMIYNTTLESNTNVYKTASPSIKIGNINTTQDINLLMSGFGRSYYVTTGKTLTIGLQVIKDILSTGQKATLKIAQGTETRGLETTEYDIVPSTSATKAVGSWSSDGADLVCNITSHGFANDTKIIFGGGTLPSLLSAQTTYYVVSQATDSFKVSTTLGGSAIARGTGGSGTTYANKWESKSIVFTNTTTSTGFISLELIVQKGASAWNMFIDDLTFTES